MRSSDIFLVSVVTRIRSFFSVRTRISWIRSSIWPLVGFTTTSGSISPVGRMICSTGRLDEVDLVVPGRRGQVDRLADAVEELLPLQRPVVHRAGQPEPVVDEVALAGHVAFVHAADLRHGHVRLVHDDEVVLREVVEQAVRRRPVGAAVHVHRVVLDAGARADLPHHLDVVRRAHPQPLGLQQLARRSNAASLVLEPCSMPRIAFSIRSGRHVVGGREDVEPRGPR